jgi:Bacteriophage HK97-gp10, putative tail-component
MAAWPGQKSRGRGQLRTGQSRSGRGFYYGGRRVLLMDAPGTEVVWAGESLVQFSDDVLEATFSTLAQRGLQYLQSITPVDTGELQDSDYVEIDDEGGRLRLTIGATAEHALFQELGTSRHGANPFIRPTFDWLSGVIGPTMRAESAARGG